MFNVKVKFKEDSSFYQAGCKEQTYRNITEIHYNYPPFGGRIALESGIDSAGSTIEIDWIEELETEEISELFFCPMES